MWEKYCTFDRSKKPHKKDQRQQIKRERIVQTHLIFCGVNVDTCFGQLKLTAACFEIPDLSYYAFNYPVRGHYQVDCLVYHPYETMTQYYLLVF